MDYSYADSFVLVFDPNNSHLHKKDSHGFSKLVCSGLEGCCWV